MFMLRFLCSATQQPESPKALYRELLKQIKQLPKNTQLYYRNYTRQYFANWDTETDPEVLKQLHQKARQDAAWVVQKYSKSN